MSAASGERSDAFAMPSRQALWRLALWLGALAGASLFWLSEHPPMVDLPAHAGQVALLRDLLLGEGRWSELLRINWLTPYLIGYGLALPLSLAVPIATALKLLLSLAYLAFVALCVRLGRHFGSDPRLDLLFLPGFFGVPFKWGFFTFLVAAPVTLAFVLLASHYARHRTAPRAAGVAALGLVMLASHGLAFLFGFCVGLALLGLATRGLDWRRRLAAAWPFIVLALGFVAYFVASRIVEAGFRIAYEYVKGMDYNWTRLLKVPLYAVGQKEDKLLLVPVALALLAVPLLMGLRPRLRGRPGAVPLAVVVAILFLVPSFALNTAFLYERFALFLLPAWAWAFPAASPLYGAAVPTAAWRRAAPALLFGLVAFVIGLYAWRGVRFGEETRRLDAAIRTLAPGERGLSIALDYGSEDTGNPYAYIHYPGWYQAERNGLVDLNFAWFPPQIVRFRPDRGPAVRPGFEWKPQKFDWHQHEGWRYRYFFVTGPVPARLFEGAPCPPLRIFHDGPFSIYENRPCERPREGVGEGAPG